MDEYKNQVIVVTGGTSEIGRCIAKTLASLGAHVVIADVVKEEAAAVSNEIIGDGGSSSHAKIDTTCVAEAESVVGLVVREHGRIDALVNNAGLDAPYRNAWETDVEHWQDVIDVNLNGAWWCSRAAIRPMMKRQSGRIVFITSIAARIPGRAISPAYAAAKAAIIGLTVSLSLQMERYGILVNAITADQSENADHKISAERRKYLREYPLGFGGPQPIAHGVAYLLGRSGNWLSGSVLNISGGRFKGI
jgi:3-oxoacyl-[acyl-carrier protein] reductase